MRRQLGLDRETARQPAFPVQGGRICPPIDGVGEGNRDPASAGRSDGTTLALLRAVTITTESDPGAGLLFVDDEINIVKALARLFRDEPIRVYTAGSGSEALELLERESIQVVVTDHRMPGMSGIELLSQIRARWPEVLRMMLTGYTNVDIALEAINRGEVYRLITKPWNDEELRVTVRHALDTIRMRREIERLNELALEQNAALQQMNGALQGMNRTLEEKVRERTKEVQEKHRELRLAYVSTVRTLAEAIDAKDPYTRGHSERVGVYASRIARELDCPNLFVERIYLAGLLHDVGKIGIPDAIITKPGRLTRIEYELIQKHPEIGARILEPVSFLSDLVSCVRHHHEWYDGSDRGYPDQLKGEQIPFPSRIILVADTVEAMTSDRPYRKAVPLDVVIREIEQFSGTQFDPIAADAFLTLIRRENDRFLETASRFDIEAFLNETEARE
jgi:putative nucleotidyltransferase with HDIG domain